MLGTYDIPLIGPFWISPSQLSSVLFYTGIKTEIRVVFFFFESLRMVARDRNPSTLEAKAEAEQRICCMFRAVLGYAVTSRSTDTAVGEYIYIYIPFLNGSDACWTQAWCLLSTLTPAWDMLTCSAQFLSAYCKTHSFFQLCLSSHVDYLTDNSKVNF